MKILKDKIQIAKSDKVIIILSFLYLAVTFIVQFANTPLPLLF